MVRKFKFLFNIQRKCLKTKKSNFYSSKYNKFFYCLCIRYIARDSDYSLKNCLFGGLELAKNADPDKYVYNGYGTGFDPRSKFSLPDGSVGKNVIIFGVDMSSSVHIEGPTQELDDTTLTAEAKYSINFSRQNKNFCLSLHYNGGKSFYFLML